MHILVTNDDGIQSPGLLALAQAAALLGKVTVLAPDRNWSMTGHVKTINRPLKVRELALPDGTPAFATDGAPSDCVAMAVLGLVEEPVDLVVSGINPYPNVGHDLTYSGTVTAAMEGAIWKIPSIAFSLDGDGVDWDVFRFDTAAGVARVVMERVIENGLPPYTLLSVNVPNLPAEALNGYTVTRQGMRIYRDVLNVHPEVNGERVYWMGGEAPTGVMEEGTDLGALHRGYVSITPVQLDLTAYRMMDAVRAWDWPA